MDVCQAAEILNVPIVAIGQIIFDGKLSPASTEEDIKRLKEQEPDYIASLR